MSEYVEHLLEDLTKTRRRLLTTEEGFLLFSEEPVLFNFLESIGISSL